MNAGCIRVLELFKGYGSVSDYLSKSKIANFDVVSLDINDKFDPTICSSILSWNYKKAYPRGHFDIIWASPPCTEYSRAKTVGERNLALADKIVKKSLEIIKYFRPAIWFVENPQTGLLKNREFMKNIPYYDVTYCKYGFDYRKPTRIWTNLKSFHPKFCNFDCNKMQDGKHLQTLGTSRTKMQRVDAHRQNYRVPSRLLSQLFKLAIYHIIRS